MRASSERLARYVRLNDLLDAAARRGLTRAEILDDLPVRAEHSPVCACRMGEAATAGASASDLYPEA